MPLNRRMLAADAELAAKLLETARRQGISLYALTNRLIQAYLHMEKAGYKDPMDAAIDLVFYNSIITTGFRITPPKLSNGEEWEKLGETLWIVTSMKTPGIDPKHAIRRLTSIIFDEKNVLIDHSKRETKIMITVPPNSQITPENLYRLLKGFIKEALGDAADVKRRESVVLVSVREG